MKQYHYTESGLDNIWLANGFEITETNGDKEIYIHDIHGLHKMIGLLLIEKQGLLSGKEIRFIRTTLDFSQGVLARLLGCTYQTVLLWEKDRGTISKTADRLLRVMFFEYLNPENDRTAYELINQIADLEAETTAAANLDKIIFEEKSDEWRRVA